MKFLKLSESYKSALILSYSYTLLTYLSSIFVVKYIFKYLNNEEYGVYILIIETLAIFEVLDFGFTGGMLAFLSRETDNYNRISKIVSTLFYPQVLLALIAGLLGCIFSFYPSLIFNSKGTNFQGSTLTISLLIAAFGLVISMIAKSYSNILYARRKIASDSILKIIALSIRLIAIFGFLRFFSHVNGILFLIFVTIISSLINLIQCIIRIKKLDSNIKINIANFSLPILKEVLPVSIWFAIGSIAIFLIERIDNVVTGKLIGPAAIAILTVSRKLFDFVKQFINQLTNNYRPYFGKMLANNSTIEAFDKFKKLSIISILVSTIAGAIAILINKYFVSIWVGVDKFGGTLLNFGMYMNLIYHAWKLPFRAYLSSSLLTKQLAVLAICEGILNLFLAYILVCNYNWGINGVIASTFFVGLPINLVFLCYIFNDNKIESIKKYIYRNLINFAIPLPIVLVLFLLQFFGVNDILQICICISSILITFLLTIKMGFPGITMKNLIKGKFL